jgi:SAM-dependent methyltransferase
MPDGRLERLEPYLGSGVSIVDIGAGRAPTLAIEDRPEGCRYTGVDISAEELEAAPAGAYTDTVAADITDAPPLDGDYDVALSWQVLEHVKPLDRTLENLRRALRPGGTLLAQTSGSRAVFSILARALPHRARVLAMSKLLGHHEEEKFPTAYDRCYATALNRMLEPWATATVVPFYRGATYFSFSRPLQRAYLAYENAIERRNKVDLATHYLIVATT